MKILLASHGFPPTHAAGAERRAERMAKWLTENNISVVVFTIEQINDPNQRMETHEQAGFLVHRLYYDTRDGESFRNLYNAPFVGECLRRILETEHFDLVHVISGYLLGVPVIEVAKEMGLPVVLTLTEFWFMCSRLNLTQSTGALCSGPESIQKCTRCLLEDKRRYRYPAVSAPAIMDLFWPLSHRVGLTAKMQALVAERQVRLRNALEAVDLVISPSQFLINKFEEFGFATQKFIHIRQGMVLPLTAIGPTANGPTEIVPEADHPQLARLPDAPLRICYVGQLKYHKGVDILLKVVTRLLDQKQNITLDLWGKETEAPEYVQRLKSLTAPYHSIHWNGSFSGNRIWDILSETDVLIVPSRWYENSPNTILEAFAMNVPVVATNLGGMAELITHEENGLLFELNDANGLQMQLERLLNNRSFIDCLRNGIQTIKTLDQEMKEIISHYSELLLCIGVFLIMGSSA